MKKACLVVSEYLQKNNIFDPSLQRDYIFDRFIKLKMAFKEQGYELSTNDIHSIDESDVVIYASNMPSRLPKKEHVEKSYLILSESPFIRPDNYDKDKHRHFNKVFTWHDDFVDGFKYIKLNYAHLFPQKINKVLSKKTKLITLIAGNKKPPHTPEGDLYLERETSIRWFEKHHPDDFDLYGIGWDRYRFGGPKLLRVWNRIPWITSLFMTITGQTYSSYKGVIDNKKPVMEKYRFSICYENARDIPGYITEKIFDSFFAGCVPVYWGANNITEYAPENCFIDKRKFSSYESLYNYLTGMSDEDYLKYLNNIEQYLKSNHAIPFTSEGFARTIVDTVFNIEKELQ